MAVRITRKQLLFGVGAIASTAALRPYRASAARRTIVKLGMSVSSDDPEAQYAAMAADEIKRETGGEVEVQVFPNSSLGSDTHMLSEVRSGAIQMMGIGDNILAILVPSAAADNIGYAFKDTKTAFAAVDATMGELVRRDIIEHGLQPMPKMWDLGFRQVTTSTKPIETPEDLKGLKLRVPESPSSLSLFKDLGAAPVTINLSQLYTSLQTGVANGMATGIPSLQTSKLYQVQKYCSLTNHMWVGYWMIMNGAFWDRLPPDHQKVIAGTFDTYALKQRAAMETFTETAHIKLTSEGIKFNSTDPNLFREKLVEAGFYHYWRKRLGSQLWSALEKYTGTLA